MYAKRNVDFLFANGLFKGAEEAQRCIALGAHVRLRRVEQHHREAAIAQQTVNVRHVSQESKRVAPRNMQRDNSSDRQQPDSIVAHLLEDPPTPKRTTTSLCITSVSTLVLSRLHAKDDNG